MVPPFDPVVVLGHCFSPTFCLSHPLSMSMLLYRMGVSLCNDIMISVIPKFYQLPVRVNR